MKLKNNCVVSDELASIIGSNEATCDFCVKKIWEYIIEHNLQCEDRSYFIPDSKLQKVFGKEKQKVFAMKRTIYRHLKTFS